MNLEYMRLRKVAEENNNTLSGNHPCLKGCSDCCTKDVAISSNDQTYIKNAISRDEISQETVNAAKKKAARSSGRSCPFLNNGCTIYEFRPVICVMTGSGGIASTKEQARQLDSRSVPGLPVRELSTTMCSRGHNILANRNTFMTGQSIIDMQEIMMHYAHDNSSTMSEFAKSLDE